MVWEPWLADPRHGDFPSKGKRFLPTDLDAPASVKTDKDGRFRLTGFGRDRVAHLQDVGRPPDRPLSSGLWDRGNGWEQTHVFPRFTVSIEIGSADKSLIFIVASSLIHLLQPPHKDQCGLMYSGVLRR